MRKIVDMLWRKRDFITALIAGASLLAMFALSMSLCLFDVDESYWMALVSLPAYMIHLYTLFYSSNYIISKILMISQVFLYAISYYANYIYLIFFICVLLMTISLVNPRSAARSGYRRPIVVCIVYGVAGASMLLFVLLLFYAEGKPFKSFIVPIISFILMAMTSSWLYAIRLAEDNEWFFSNVLVSRQPNDILREDIPIEIDEDTFFFNTLIRPAETVTRIREKISPDIGCFNIETKYEFAIPKRLLQSDKIVLPVTLQRKNELNIGMSIECEDGLVLRKLTDAEVTDKITKGIRKVFNNKSDLKPSQLNSFAKELANFALAEPVDDSDRAFYDARQRFTNKWGNSLESTYEQLAMTVLSSLRFIKPVCVELCRENAEVLNKKCLRIKVCRTLSLVPVREAINGERLKLKGRIKKLLTKRRMRYYFNLGNADCTQSYHLTFCGPEKTYLSDIELRGVSGGEFLIAERMEVTNRFDQQFSRLYVRNGRGCNRFILAISYEERSHRSIMALCGTSTVSFITLFFILLQYVYQTTGSAIGSSDIMLPLTVLSVSGMLSIWEAMEEHRSEEWLWLGSTVSVVVSVMAILHLVLITTGAISGIGVQDIFLWTLYTCIEFFVLLAAIVALFEKVKQHGALIDIVPQTRTAADAMFDSFKCDFEAIIGNQKNCTPNSTAQNAQPAGIRSVDRLKNKNAKYHFDIRFYSMFIGENWSDGWLVPIWCAALNPHSAPSVDFYEYASKVIEANKGSAKPCYYA